MSRCFPFPPPGYESKARSDPIDLLTKEKHKEKKHKKEKKDKKKRESKEKEDKDRSKHKHKHREKKDRKEKHENNRRDKDKNSRTDGQVEGHTREKTLDSSQKGEKIKDPKFSEEFDRRIRDENGAHGMLESFTPSIERKAEGFGTASAIEKEWKNRIGIVTVLNSEDQRSNVKTGEGIEKNAGKKIEGKDKVKDKQNDDRKGEKHRDREKEEKRSKRKDKHRHKGKEKEKERASEKNGHGHDTSRETLRNGQIDSVNFKLLASHKSNMPIDSDANNKKRKDPGMNGLLHKDDVRPNKLPKLVGSSDAHVENGRTVDPLRIATPQSSIGHQPSNNLKPPERALDNKEYKISGTSGGLLPRPSVTVNALQKVETSLRPPQFDKISGTPVVPLSRPSVVVNACQNVKVSRRPPHPDSKYLSRIYTVPVVDDGVEPDDQEWLFNSNGSRPKPKKHFEALEVSQVWDEATRIEPEDVLALPYVIPY